MSGRTAAAPEGRRNRDDHGLGHRCGLTGRAASGSVAAVSAALLLALLPSPAPADATAYRITRASSEIKIDGSPDDPAWQTALKLEIPFEVMPGENIPAPVATDCRLTYDSANLYVLFLAHDPRPEEVRARLSDRDGGWGDDRVGLMLDPFNDECRAFEFFVNPLGVQADLFRNDLASDDNEDETWDTIWSTAGRLTEDGYVVEIGIPFSSLRFPRTEEEQTWGFSLFRDYWRDSRHQLSLAPYDRNRNCMICQYAKITGLQGISPGRSLEFDPTFTARRHDENFGGANWRGGAVRTDLGLSTRWAITPNLNINAAVNPDFSQVEADAAQLDVNTRYALSYQERRPFFLEGADLFQTSLPIVYTRSVADPIWGAKLTGKIGASALGVFVTRDEKNNLYIPADGGDPESYSYDDEVTGAVLRYRRDLGPASTIGALATLRESGRYHNRVYGLDGRLRFVQTERVRFQILGSDTRYQPELARSRGLPGRELQDYALDVAYGHDSRNWSWTVDYQDYAPDFRADAGFLERVDVRGTSADLSHTWWGKPGAAITQTVTGTELIYGEDHRGTPTDRNLKLYTNISGPRELYLRPNFEHKMERYADHDFATDFGLLRFGIRPSGALNIWGVVAYGDGVDYANEQLARRHWGGPGFSYNFGRHVEFYIDHTYEYMSRDRERIYNANLIQSRLVYQFTSRAFARCIFQLTDVDYNPAAFRPVPPDPAPPYGRTWMLLQLLGSYKVNAQTVVYLGYSDRRLGKHPPDVRPQERTFFAKVGYAWLV
jgi:hypothetical protein